MATPLADGITPLMVASTRAVGGRDLSDNDSRISGEAMDTDNMIRNLAQQGASLSFQTDTFGKKTLSGVQTRGRGLFVSVAYGFSLPVKRTFKSYSRRQGKQDFQKLLTSSTVSLHR